MNCSKYEKVRKYFVKNHILVLVIILIMQCATVIGWGMQKERLNVDEMFTLEGSKQGGYGQRYWDHSEDFFGREHTGREFRDWLTTFPEELLIRQDASEIVSTLFKRDIYYVLINLATTACPGVLTHWIGAGLNMFFFIVSQILLFCLARKLEGNSCALLTVAVYGFSAGAISTVLYIRCYMMLAMMLLATIMLYIKLDEAKKNSQRIMIFIGLYLLLIVGYEVHSFSIILFGITTVFFLIYFIVKKHIKSLIWFIGGYGIPAVLGWEIVYARIGGTLGGTTGQIFFGILRGSGIRELIYRGYLLMTIVAGHLLTGKAMVFIAICGFLSLFIFLGVKKKNAFKVSAIVKGNILEILIILIPIVYSMVLVIGSAIAWKYISPVYPLFVLSLTLLWYKAARMIKARELATLLFAGALAIVTVVSYCRVQISELFIGQEALREEINEKYHDWNGIMVHHGLSENWLYEAATLWPEDSHVLLVKNEVLHDRELCYNRPDEKILLWLTIDYDNDEVIEELKECTDYKDVELAFTTDSLLVYECTK